MLWQDMRYPWAPEMKAMDMDISGVLKALIVLLTAEWYKALTFLGIVVLVVSLFRPAYGLTNPELQLLSAGIFLVGLGEWKHHKTQLGIKPANAYTGPAMALTITVRGHDRLGMILMISGGIFISSFGIWKVVQIWKAVHG
ncbi:MAG: hypothetical protein WCA89_06670 [Terracidiphilus sp.]|jgi:hypothetical protein